MIDKSNRIVVDFDRQTTWDAMLKALEKAKRGSIKVESVNKTTGHILINIGVSLFSWGENVTININPIDEKQTEVTLTSGSKFALIDWGKNKKNITNLVELFSDELEAINK